MSLDPTAAGLKVEGHRFEYDWKAAALYALGIGARKADLEYLYEGRGLDGGGRPRVFPSFAVVPPAGAVQALFERSGGDVTRMVHGSQRIRLHRALPPAATVVSEARISGIYDLKRLADLRIETRSWIEGELAFETEWTLIFLDDGGFGGPPPPKNEVPRIAKDAVPTFVVEDRATEEQALLYRLSGDHNPLHADPEFAARAGFTAGPILHGLCTFGFATRAVVQAACGADPTRLVELAGQFRKPVWPGDTIRTTGYDLGEGKFALQVHAGGRSDAVMTSCWAKVRREDE